MKKKILLPCLVLCLTLIFVLAGCSAPNGSNYTIKQIDLSVRPAYASDAKYDDLYNNIIVDNGDKGEEYMAHPDTILNNKGELITVYPAGHGKGAILKKTSTDYGKTWSDRDANTPKSWEKSMETPTIYTLDFNDGSRKLVLTSANPSWNNGAEYYEHGKNKGDGFNASYSNDEGETWTEFQKFYGYGDANYVNPIVAMASLTRLKDDNGNWMDAWMGFFHDYDFYNYKTILTFDSEGNMHWSTPEKYFSNYRDIEKKSQMCEVEVIRSEGGQGDQLCLLTRSNAKNMNSLISFSNDEGKTWSEPKELPAALSGERHKAEWLNDGRLFITFRSIERDGAKWKKYKEKNSQKWYSEGWIAWVGTFDDLVNSKEGQYRVKVAHTYLDKQKEPQVTANGDTGYCGNAVLPDGKVFTCSYGKFGEKIGKDYKTYIVGKVIDVKLLDELVAKM